MTSFIQQENQALLDGSGQPVPIGGILVSDARFFKASGGVPPQHAASSGRVFGNWLDNDAPGEYFPNVFDCKWVDQSAPVAVPVAVPVAAPLEPVVALINAIQDMIAEQVAEHVKAMVAKRGAISDIVRSTIDELAESGHFQDMANDGDFDDAIERVISDGEYMTMTGTDLTLEIGSVLQDMIDGGELTLTLNR
jgi:hypothetical protein